MSATPFNVLFQQAAALKTAQLAVDRTKFDSWDVWYQHSLFSREDIRDIRNVNNFEQRFGFAKNCKQRGNDHYRDQDYEGAINEYERCLSIFEWVEPNDPDWKNKGIQDKLLTEQRYPRDSCINTEEVRQVDELKLTCILNLSMCYWKTADWANCIRACNRALQMDPQNTKALYRRAQARTIPAYCGMTENLLALEDLKKAVFIKPDDSMLTTAYAELKISLSEQKKKDKKTFSNLFDRKEAISADITSSGADNNNNSNTGSALSSSSSSSSKAAANKSLTWQDAFNMVKDMESAAARCERDGLPAQAASIRAKKEELQQQMMEYFPAHLQKPFPELMAAAQSNASAAATTTASVSVEAAKKSGGSGKKGKAKKAAAATASPHSTVTTEKSATTTTITATASGAAAATVTISKGAKTSSGGANSTGGSAKANNNSNNCARSKVTTAAGGELSGAWFDVYGNDYDLVDFSHPTQEMIEDAKTRGLDLTDVRVQQLMQEINKVRIKNTRMDERLGRGPGSKAGGRGSGGKGGGAGESVSDTAQRMEAYMQEALQNIHSEEAGRITTTLLTDITVATQRKMLATRLQFEADVQTERLLHKRGHKLHHGSTSSTSKIHSSSNQSKKHSGKRRGQESSTASSELDSSCDNENDDDDKVLSGDVSESDVPGGGDSADEAHTSGVFRNSDGQYIALRPGFTAHNVFNTEIDPERCDPAQLTRVLKEMMVADIVQLRQALEKEEYDRSMRARNSNSAGTAGNSVPTAATAAATAGGLKSKKKKGKAANSTVATAGAGAAAGTGERTAVGVGASWSKKYTPEEEEAARLSLSEEIVDMLEARYGTAMHSGEAAATTSALSSPGILRSGMVVAVIACAVLFFTNLILRLLMSLQLHPHQQHRDSGLQDPADLFRESARSN